MIIFEDTKNMNADYYLDSSGREESREWLLEQLAGGYTIGMFYYIDGYVSLRIAVEVVGRDACEGACTVEEWMRDNGKADWLGEYDILCDTCAKYMHVDHEEEDGTVIWICPKCKSTIEQPDDWGEYNLEIQQVPKKLLSQCVTLLRVWPDGLCVWLGRALNKDQTDVTAPDRILKDVDMIQEISRILDIQELDFLGRGHAESWVRWPVITDNKSVKEMVEP